MTSETLCDPLIRELMQRNPRHWVSECYSVQAAMCILDEFASSHPEVTSSAHFAHAVACAAADAVWELDKLGTPEASLTSIPKMEAHDEH